MFRPSVLIIYGVSTECINKDDVFRPSVLKKMTRFDRVATTTILHANLIIVIMLLHTTSTQHSIIHSSRPRLLIALQLSPPEKMTMLVVTGKEPPA